VTDAVLEEVATWQGRPLDAVCPLVFVDSLRVKIHDEGLVRNKAVHIAFWRKKYPAIGPSRRRAWNEVVPFYAFPSDVRRILYTMNSIEALNSKLRRAVRARGHFPHNEAAAKLLFLILNRTEKEWRMPPREWAMAKAQFAVIFGERFIRAMAG
jgi:transposase-like protein